MDNKGMNCKPYWCKSQLTVFYKYCHGLISININSLPIYPPSSTPYTPVSSCHLTLILCKILCRQQSYFPCTVPPSFLQNIAQTTVILPTHYCAFIPVEHCAYSSHSSHALSHLPSCRTLYSHSSHILSHLPSHTTLYRQQSFFPSTIPPSFPYNIVQTTVVLPKHYPTFLLAEHPPDNSCSSHMLSHLPSHTTLYRQVILPKHYPTFLLVGHCTDNSFSSHMLSHLPSHTTLYRQQSFFPSTIPPSFLLDIVQTTVVLPTCYPTFLPVEHHTNNSCSSHTLCHLPVQHHAGNMQSFFPCTIPPFYRTLYRHYSTFLPVEYHTDDSHSSQALSHLPFVLQNIVLVNNSHSSHTLPMNGTALHMRSARHYL